MFNNQEFSNQELNNEKLHQLQEGLFEEISEAESENVNGGYFWNPYPNPWTPVIVGTPNPVDTGFDYWMEWFTS